MDPMLLQKIEQDPNLKLLKRVPETFLPNVNGSTPSFNAAIIDLETMGLDPLSDEIIEIGILWFSFNSNGISSIAHTYNELQDPKRPIPEEITKITGITDADVKDRQIDWQSIHQYLAQTHLIICHNSKFDRNFLECQTPDNIQQLIKTMPFACTIHDINWSERGFESSKLDYLNFKLGYFYDGHRALNDCYATFNLLAQVEGAFDELKANVRKKETLIVAQNAPFEKKDLLKNKNYRWSDGQASLPIAWWLTLPNEQLEEELAWLDAKVYGRSGASLQLPQVQITARKRYSLRAQKIDVA
jgi:DNA polymerase-3 subunit epsilon